MKKAAASGMQSLTRQPAAYDLIIMYRFIVLSDCCRLRLSSIPRTAGFELFRISELFSEVTIQQTLESTAMAGFILSHLMNGVMDCIKVGFLCSHSSVKLT